MTREKNKQINKLWSLQHQQQQKAKVGGPRRFELLPLVPTKAEVKKKKKKNEGSVSGSERVRYKVKNTTIREVTILCMVCGTWIWDGKSIYKIDFRGIFLNWIEKSIDSEREWEDDDVSPVPLLFCSIYLPSYLALFLFSSTSQGKRNPASVKV